MRIIPSKALASARLGNRRYFRCPAGLALSLPRPWVAFAVEFNSGEHIIRAMSIAPLPADFEQSADGLVEMEIELTRLLIEYDELRTAWPKGGHVLVRARIGRQVADTLARINDLEHEIATTPARTPAEAAVRRRRLAALEQAGLVPWGAF